MNAIERRVVPMELRVERREGAIRRLSGHAALFNSLSEDLGGFKEQIAPGAFAGVLKDDVRALWNHDPNFVLGRTKSGTMRMREDKTGLAVEIDLPNTHMADDLLELIDRGDVSQMSFAFTVAPDGDTWSKDADGGQVRTILKLGHLYDASPVTYPAYPATDVSVALRSLEQARLAEVAGGTVAAALKAVQDRRARRVNEVARDLRLSRAGE
jgi:Escherichia/Staphylococcus phage prohead protease